MAAVNGYAFQIASGSASAGATYSHNSVIYTVSATVSGATRVIMTGTATPLTSGMLTKVTGVGDATLTFTSFTLVTERNLPPVPYSAPITNAQGLVSPVWAAWFRQAFFRMGGHAAKTNEELNSGALEAGSISTIFLADEAVTTAKIDDGAVTADKLATDAVTTVKIDDEAVTTAKIANNAVTNAKAAQMPTLTIKGNDTGGTANAKDLTVTEVTAMLDSFTGDSGSGGVKGLVPAPASGDAAASKFLKADGTWASPAGSSATAPLVTRYTSGSGDHSVTGTPLYMRVRMVGGGGGGAQSTSAGGNGASTTFGTSLLTAPGGSGAGSNANGALPGAGGAAGTINSPAVGWSVQGGGGAAGSRSTTLDSAGNGGASYFGGEGRYANSAGGAGAPNSGAGGSGNIGGGSGAGGGAGTYVEAIIPSPDESYSWAVGDGGAAGGTAGEGADGVIIVEEHYK